MNAHKTLPRLLIAGGAGFIGSSFVRKVQSEYKAEILVIDKTPYSSGTNNLKYIGLSKDTKFSQIDICNFEELKLAFDEFKPTFVVNFAAESHVDKSIDAPIPFVNNNVNSVINLLEISKQYWSQLSKNKAINAPKPNEFRFLQVSTDEVYGSLTAGEPSFSELNLYDPTSPYAASKAAGDHLCRAWAKTYGLPINITCCSNNFGPYQFPEKLIPLMITNAIEKRPLPLYGDGKQVRDWLYVDDHVDGILKCLTCGKEGETYNLGGNHELTNVQIVSQICSLLDKHIGNNHDPNFKHSDLITHVADRPGHDQRYSIDFQKAERALGWKPKFEFGVALEKTVEWYLKNETWVAQTRSFAMRRQGVSF